MSDTTHSDAQEATPTGVVIRQKVGFGHDEIFARSGVDSFIRRNRHNFVPQHPVEFETIQLPSGNYRCIATYAVPFGSAELL